ncbi:hypothetical protein [Hydrogenivirga sp. 128-5-R1-1]|uniref:hypothetical protein n=1 Tax=Hydrogenivirga sp. 128-5-R1-1 TaxID=392423 RepID=UPI00015F3656|nr:hypothetical protein [Hydrogenivirga sp. 128-5-R1-1]EDP76671.1 hypothetical protein HG1285_03653 [Hydrogenivirga sp. 128-5-R1-1]
MGKLASFLISRTTRRVVVLKKKGKRFEVELVDRGAQVLDEHRDENAYISISYPELIHERLELPPVQDEDTLRVLIKKGLSESAGVSEEVFIVYREAEEESGAQKKSLRVFALPTSALQSLNLDEEIIRESQFFTLSQLSVAGISRFVSADQTVFHVFLDEDTLTMTVSSGDEVLYTRSVAIPPYARETGLEDFLYENINMTYIFVAQRSNIPVDLILLSGEAIKMDSLAESLVQLTSGGVAVPVPSGTFGGINGETFNEFLPCFGTLLLPEDYDFSPEDVKERRAFKRFLGRALPVLGLFLLLLLPLFGIRLYSLYSTSERIDGLSRLIELQARSLLKDPTLKEPLFTYYKTYLGAIDESRLRNPLRVLSDMEGLIRLVRAKAYAMEVQNDKLRVQVYIEKRFPRLYDMTLFQEKLSKLLEELGSKGYSYRTESENRDLKNNRLSVMLIVEKGI